MNSNQRKKQKKMKKWMKKAHKQTMQINQHYRKLPHQLPKQAPVPKTILPHVTGHKHKKIRFDDLPDDIISKIASFFTISCYICFEKLNNRITKILHNPYCLSSLNLYKSTMLSHSYKYNRITQLHIDISQMYKCWPAETTIKWSHIEALSIRAAKISSHELFHILFSGAINFISIKTLRIYDLQIDWTDFHQCTFLFPNVENVRLYQVHFSSPTDDDSDDDIDEDDEKIDKYIGLEQIFPKLKALKMTGLQTDFTRRMCHVFGDKLYLLGCDDTMTIPNTERFAIKLTEVRASCTTLSLILNKSNNLQLKRVHMTDSFSFICKKLTDVMSNLLKEQRLLECISILTADYSLTNVITAMTNELIKLRDNEQKRKGLKIRLDIGNMTNFGLFKRNVLKIVTVLDYYTHHDWMVIVSCLASLNDSICISKLISLCEGKYNVDQQYRCEDTNSYVCRVVISNKQCKINGYKEQWLL